MRIEVCNRTVELTEDNLGILNGSMPVSDGQTIEITSSNGEDFMISYMGPGGGVGSTYMLEAKKEDLPHTLGIFIRELCMTKKIELV